MYSNKKMIQPCTIDQLTFFLATQKNLTQKRKLFPKKNNTSNVLFVVHVKLHLTNFRSQFANGISSFFDTLGKHRDFVHTRYVCICKVEIYSKSNSNAYIITAYVYKRKSR